MRFYLYIFVLLLCSCSQPKPIVKIQDISEYEYEKLRGHNAAISQFGIGNEDLFVDLENKRIIVYASQKEDIANAYADGYHKALDMIQRRASTVCPDLH